jgi:hypothetical protein
VESFNTTFYKQLSFPACGIIWKNKLLGITLSRNEINVNNEISKCSMGMTAFWVVEVDKRFSRLSSLLLGFVVRLGYCV